MNNEMTTSTTDSNATQILDLTQYCSLEVIDMNMKTDTTDIATDTKPAVKAYPFRSKKDILAQLATDRTFREECLVILYSRQTETEQARRITKDRNARGFMSSHAVWGCKIAEKILVGDEELSPEESDRMGNIVSRYSTQLASHFRTLHLEEHPELAEAAKVFGV